MYANANNKQKLDIINWTLNKLELKRIKEIESENSISSSLFPNNIRIEALEVCDSIEDTVTKVFDKILHFKILPPHHPGSICNLPKEPSQECEIFSGFVMLSNYGKEAGRRVSQVMPLKPKIPIYILSAKPQFDHNEAEAALEIISKLHWEHIIVISDNLEIIHSFNEKAAKLNKPVCITRNAYIKKKLGSNTDGKYEILFDINVYDNKIESNEMDRNSPFRYSHDTLNDALSSALQNSTITKTGHKIVTLLSMPISFYLEDNISFNQNTIEALELTSTINSTDSVIDKTDEKEKQKLPTNESETWLFVLNGKDTETETEHVHMPFFESLDNIVKSESTIFILRKAFYTVPEFMKHINTTARHLNDSTFMDEYPNVIDLI